MIKGSLQVQLTQDIYTEGHLFFMFLASGITLIPYSGQLFQFIIHGSGLLPACLNWYLFCYFFRNWQNSDLENVSAVVKAF